MADTIRVGIIGAGWFAAQTHVPALRAVPGVEIVAACRRSPERLKEFADKLGVPQTFTDHEAMLEQVPLDAAIVCSPHALHAVHVKAALQHDLHVLTDKPLAIYTADAQELIQIAELRNRTLAVFFGPAYDSRNRYVARQVREGVLGRLVHADWSYFANPAALGFFGGPDFPDDPIEFPITPTTFRANAQLGGGGYLQDVGNHGFSALLVGTGLQAAEVTAVMDHANLDLRAVVSMKFTSGAVGTVTVIGDTKPPVEGYWGVGRWGFTGDLGGVWKEIGDESLHRQMWGAALESVPAAELPPPTNPDENFIQAVRGEAELIAQATEAIECVRAIEAAYLSARTGKTVTVER